MLYIPYIPCAQYIQHIQHIQFIPYADQCVAGNCDNSDTFDAVGLLQSYTKIILQADRDNITNHEADEASNTKAYNYRNQ